MYEDKKKRARPVLTTPRRALTPHLHYQEGGTMNPTPDTSDPIPPLRPRPLSDEEAGVAFDGFPEMPTQTPERDVGHSKRRASKAPKSPPKRKGVRRRETVLYRYYDDQDVLLYVGMSANMPGRLEGHEEDSTWMDFAARSTLEHFPERDDAEAAEQAAIEEHGPIFNILHNDRPDRVRRIVDYLIEQDRRDLLVPLISRG